MAKWWLVTWTTYGTWLPGDPRGFQTWRGHVFVPPPKRYAKPGEPTYNPDDHAERYRQSLESLNETPVFLTQPQCVAAMQAIVEELREMPMQPSILAIGRVHSHFLAQFRALEARPAVGRLKAAATQKLHENGLASARVWCRDCHLKSKAPGKEFRDAFVYVYKHRHEGAEVYVWPAFRLMIPRDL